MGFQPQPAAVLPVYTDSKLCRPKTRLGVRDPFDDSFTRVLLPKRNHGNPFFRKKTFTRLGDLGLSIKVLFNTVELIVI